MNIDHAPLPLLPDPVSVLTSEGFWETTDPWGEVSIGVNADLGPTEYSVSVGAQGAAISAGSEAALADGRNMFSQLVLLSQAAAADRRGNRPAPETGEDAPAAGSSAVTETSLNEAVRIPRVIISDAPARAWRGVMIDVVSHFLTVEELKPIIEAMAVYRLNVLHLHLTGDAGWRLEIQGYPKLTEVGAWRGDIGSTRHGGFYTQDEFRELVAFADQMGVQIVPEISLPGHMRAAVAAYPEIGNAPQRTVTVAESTDSQPSDVTLGLGDAGLVFLRDVLSQTASLTSAPFIHIGGDEVSLVEWETSAEARARMDEWGAERVIEIPGRITALAADILSEHGKRVVVWEDAVMSHLPEDLSLVVMCRRGEESLERVLERGFAAVVATDSELGLHHPQALFREPAAVDRSPVTVKSIARAQLLPESTHNQHLVIGGEALLFTHHVDSAAQAQYLLFPRLLAVAERLWGPTQDQLDLRELQDRIAQHARVLDLLRLTHRAR